MSYVIRNIRPSIIHIPDADLRLDSGQTAIVNELSPQMQELLVNRALEAISSDPDPPAATVPVKEETMTTEETPSTESVASVDAVSATPVTPVKKTRKSHVATATEPQDDAQ